MPTSRLSHLSPSLRKSLSNVDMLIKIVVVHKILGDYLSPAPSRPTIISWINSGKLEGRKYGKGENWFVYHSSLDNLIRESQAARQHKLAA